MDYTEGLEHCIDYTNEGVRVRVRLIPRAKHEGIVGVHGGQLKVAVHAPPVDGEANDALLEVLADFFGVAQSRLRIIHGLRGKDKVVEIVGRS